MMSTTVTFLHIRLQYLAVEGLDHATGFQITPGSISQEGDFLIISF